MSQQNKLIFLPFSIWFFPIYGDISRSFKIFFVSFCILIFLRRGKADQICPWSTVDFFPKLSPVWFPSCLLPICIAVQTFLKKKRKLQIQAFSTINSSLRGGEKKERKEETEEGVGFFVGKCSNKTGKIRVAERFFREFRVNLLPSCQASAPSPRHFF